MLSLLKRHDDMCNRIPKYCCGRCGCRCVCFAGDVVPAVANTTPVSTSTTSEYVPGSVTYNGAFPVVSPPTVVTNVKTVSVVDPQNAMAAQYATQQAMNQAAYQQMALNAQQQAMNQAAYQQMALNAQQGMPIIPACAFQGHLPGYIWDPIRMQYRASLY